MFRWRRRQTERDQLLEAHPNLVVTFSATQAARSLWEFGEDVLAERALAMTDADLEGIPRIAAHFENPNYPLPMTGQNISHGHVHAFAAIMYFEGTLRPLARTRRRPKNKCPERFIPVAVSADDQLAQLLQHSKDRQPPGTGSP